MIFLTPPPTTKELQDLSEAFRHNIPEPDFIQYSAWYNAWGIYLIALRRCCQRQFLTEAYNEHSPRT